MIGPEEFKISSPDGDYYINFEIDMYSLSFPILFHPCSLKREVIKYLEATNKKKDQFVNIMLVEWSDPVNTHNVLPLLATINFIPKSMDLPEEEDQNRGSRIKQFRDYVDQICASGELDCL